MELLQFAALADLGIIGKVVPILGFNIGERNPGEAKITTVMVASVQLKKSEMHAECPDATPCLHFLTTPMQLCASLGMQLALLLSLAWGAAVAGGVEGLARGERCESLGEQEAQRAVLQRINALRAAGAVCGASSYVAADPLRWNVQLLKAAQSHSSDMAGNNYFSHSSPKGGTMAQRVQASGYTFTRLGENIAAGQATASATLDGWMKSPGHCQNLMNPAFEDVALACVRTDQSRYRQYWTMNLGRP